MKTIAPLAVLLLLTAALPAQALTVTARVAGANLPVHSGPGDRYAVVGIIADGTEIPVDQCTQNDSDSPYGSWIGDAGYSLRGANARQWCRVPGYGWVDKTWVFGRGLVNVTPPDFAGAGW